MTIPPIIPVREGAVPCRIIVIKIRITLKYELHELRLITLILSTRDEFHGFRVLQYQSSLIHETLFFSANLSRYG